MIAQPPPSLSIHARLLHRLASLTPERRVEALECWNERAAIREHDGGATRAAAEEDAAAETCAQFGVEWR